MKQQYAYARKRIAILTLLLVQATSFFMESTGFLRSYPVKEVTKPTMECKQKHRKDLGSDCKINTPRVKNGDYNALKNDTTARLVYSVLRGGTYSDGWAMQSGAHEGVDIVSSEGTPIYAVEAGEVIRAGAAAGYGNLVTIKHILKNKKTVQSVYGHLESITVAVGDKVKEGQQVGTMGHEGMARGNHLHFAINTTQDYIYTFKGCLDYPKTSDYTIVEKGLCRELLLSRTIDPIAFIEAAGLIPSPSVQLATTAKQPLISSIKERLLQKKVNEGTTKVSQPLTSSTTISLPITPSSPSTTVSSPTSSKVVTSFTSTQTKVSEEFLKKRNVGVTSNFGESLKKGGSSTISLTITNTKGEGFGGVLDKEITITPTKQNISLSPRVIRYVSEGNVISFIEAKESGNTDLVVSYGKDVIGKLTVKVE